MLKPQDTQTARFSNRKMLKPQESNRKMLKPQDAQTARFLNRKMLKPQDTQTATKTAKCVTIVPFCLFACFGKKSKPYQSKLVKPQ